MELVTKEHLNSKDIIGQNNYFLSDIPIWEEFALGLYTTGGIALNNPFRGFRAMFCHTEDKSLSKVICIVKPNPNEMREFHLFEKRFKIDEEKGRIKSLNITRFKRKNKDVFVIEYKDK